MYKGEDIEYVDIRPNSTPQLQFYNNAPLNDETLYGGAAGGGKTQAIVTLPLYHGFHDVSGFRGQIFRETRPQLEQWIIPLTKMYYPLAGGVFHEQKLMWTFPSGAVMQLCYMEHKGDWKRYASGNNAYQAFDEATEIHEENYTVTAWNRSKCGVKPFIVYGTNPGGRSHKKFKTQFVDLCPPIKNGLMRWSKAAGMWWQPMRANEPVDVLIEFNGVKKYIRRQYIPARVFDNEDLLKANPNYIVKLMLLSPDKARKLLEGDWSLVEGQFFEMLREDIHFVKSKELPKEWRRRAAIDYGSVTAGLIGAEDNNKALHITNEWTEVGKDTTEKAYSWKKFLIANNYAPKDMLTFADHNMFYVEREREVKLTPADKFKNIVYTDCRGNLKMVSKKKGDNKDYRIFANDVMKDSISWEKDKNGMFTRYPKLYVHYDKCPKLCETLPLLQKDKNNPDDIDQDNDIDHHYDAAKMLKLGFRGYFIDKETISDVTARINSRRNRPGA